MRKILLTIFIFLLTATTSFADSVYNAQDMKMSGRIDGVIDGVIQIKNNGSLVTVIRSDINPIYPDTVYVRKRFISKKVIKYTGQIIFADNICVKIKNSNEIFTIPRFRVNEIIMYVQ